MKDTTEIQKQIEKKAKDELSGIITSFINQIEKYNPELYATAEISYHNDRSGKCEFTFAQNVPAHLEQTLRSLVYAAYLEKLTKKKTAELLTKLELI